MLNNIKSYSLIILILFCSCSENPVEPAGGSLGGGDIFYLKLLQPSQSLLSATYSINADGTNNKLFRDSMWVTSTSYHGKIALALLDSGLYFGKMYVLNTDGTNMIQIPRNNMYPVYYILSPRGDKVLFTSDAGNYMCVVNSDGTNFMQLSNGITGTEIVPQFSPDGNFIAYFESTPGSSTGLYIINTNGTGKILIKDSITYNYGATLAWSPDGNKIVFENNDPFPTDICTINKDGSGYIRLTDGTNPSWSPDGTKICFMNYINQATDLLLMNADGSNKLTITNTTSQYENSARWSPDSKKILYSNQPGFNITNLRMYDLISLSTRVLADSAAGGFWKY